jgi:hypothetical protein
MLLAIHDHPAIVRSSMTRAVSIVDTGRELVRIGKEGLTVGKDLGMRRRCNDPVETIIRHNLD